MIQSLDNAYCSIVMGTFSSYSHPTSHTPLLMLQYA